MLRVHHASISVVSVAIFGLAPAVRLSRVDLTASLNDATRGSSGGAACGPVGPNLRTLLVVAELALSVMLLIGAGLLVRSFAHLQRVSPGFNPPSVLTLELTMTGRKYNDADAVLNTYRSLWQRAVAAAGRHGGRWRHGAAAQRHDGVGADHHRRTDRA